MKKLSIIIVLLFFGCATAPYTPDPVASARGHAIFMRVNADLKTELQPFIEYTESVNARVDNDRIYVTHGIFQYDDATVTFIIAHELSHAKLNHVQHKQVLSLGITAGMIVINTLVPGAGLLNHLINPAVVNNFSKPQELEADALASDTCLKMGIPLSKQIEIMESLRVASDNSGGGFWSQHPSWDDRIENIVHHYQTSPPR